MTGAVAVALAASGAILAVAAPASAVAPTGGCWVYEPTTPANIEDTNPLSETSSALAPWSTSTPSWTITTSGNTLVGQTRDFSLTYDVGPNNAGPSVSGRVYYYFSVGGVNLPVVDKAFSAAGGTPIAGDTITGSYTITASGSQTVKLRKVIYDIPTFGTRVQCNGQTSGVKENVGTGINPATTPVDTNVVSAAFTAIGPTSTITSITSQAAGVINFARLKDKINLSFTNFTPGTAAISLCNTSGASCDTVTSTATIAGDGTGTGQITVGSTAFAPTSGARAVKVVSGSDTTLTPITIGPAQPTTLTNVPGGGAGTIVTVSGDGWDPNSTLLVGGYESSGSSGVATADVLPTVPTDATGHFSVQLTVNDPDTKFIQTFKMHNAAGAPPVVLFGSVPYLFSGDDCTAKTGTATTGTCSMLQTVKLKVNAGDLSMAKVAGDVILSEIDLDGTAQTSTGSLQDITVQDYRGGALGWSLVGKFTGLTGPATIAPDKLTWTPSCTADSTNNNDTVVAGGAAAFTDATTELPLCKVATSGLGADGTSGGDTAADADLELAVGANQAAGDYTGTLTLILS